MSLKFFADENIPYTIVSQLNNIGIDTESVRSQSLKGAGDKEIIRYCIKNGRILITMDRDFVSGLEKEYNHCGILKFKSLYSVGRMIKDVQKVNSSLSKQEMNNTVVHLPWKNE